MTIYKSKAEAAHDRACLDQMRAALNAANRAMRLDDCRLWTIRGSRGYASTWGDGQTWMLAVNSVTPRRWTFIKQRMAAFPGLAQVTQDGDDEGVFRLMRLPASVEAAEIRRVVGIRQPGPSTPIGRLFTPAKTGVSGLGIAPSDQPATQVAQTAAPRKTPLNDANSDRQTDLLSEGLAPEIGGSAERIHAGAAS
jgi:hypothetical protein